jgi:limonene-1,2-epoxide hydrolase
MGQAETIAPALTLSCETIAHPSTTTSRRGSSRTSCATTSTGMLPGSEVHNIASSGGGVFTERTDVFEMGDKRITFRVNAVFEVVDGKIAAWREYYDSVDLARQLGVEVVEE